MKFFARVEKKVGQFEKQVRHQGDKYTHGAKKEVNKAEAREEAKQEKEDDGKDGSDGTDASATKGPEGPNAVALAQVGAVGGGASLSVFVIAAVAFSVMGFRSQRRRFWATTTAERPLLG